MSQFQSASFKLDLNNPNHKKAMQYLSTIDRSRFPTVGDAIVTSVVHYFENVEGTGAVGAAGNAVAGGTTGTSINGGTNGTAVNGGTNGLAEGDLRSTIEEAVEKAIEKSLPKYLEEYLSGTALSPKTGVVESDVKTSGADLEKNVLSGIESEIDWGFLGGE